MNRTDGASRFRDEHGEKLSFEEVYDRYFDAVFRYILHRVANVAEAEDLTAGTFFKALRGAWKFRWTGIPALAWLYRIATNEVNSFLRKGERDRYQQVEPDGFAGDLQPDLELEEAERDLARSQIFLELNACIRELKCEDQTLLVLRYLEDKSFKEIAEILGKRVGALTMRTHRALDKLKHHLSKRGIDYEEFRGSFEEPRQARGQGGAVQAATAS